MAPVVEIPQPEGRHRVVVVGGGFGGLQAVRKLRRTAVDVTLVDRQNFHLFQPLAYQVATGALSAAEIASPLRAVLKRQRNARVLLAEASGFDLEHRRVVLDRLADGEENVMLGYDTLVVAGGAAYSYFGHDGWQAFAPELKSLEGALEIRSRILTAFEAAEVAQDEEARRSWLTFVVVGAGPTGVEMAGQIAELGARHPAPQLPGRGHAHGPGPARRDCRPRAHRVPAHAVGEGGPVAGKARSHASGRTHRGGRHRRLGDDPRRRTARASRSAPAPSSGPPASRRRRSPPRSRRLRAPRSTGPDA